MTPRVYNPDSLRAHIPLVQTPSGDFVPQKGGSDGVMSVTSGVRSQSTVTIASGQTNSTALNLSGTALLGFQVPSGWTGSIKLQASLDSASFADIYGSDGAQVGLIASPVAGAFYAVDVAALLPWPFVRFVDGTAPGSNLSIPVITRPLA